jgi:hypothetical protein
LLDQGSIKGENSFEKAKKTLQSQHIAGLMTDGQPNMARRSSGVFAYHQRREEKNGSLFNNTPLLGVPKKYVCEIPQCEEC